MRGLETRLARAEKELGRLRSPGGAVRFSRQLDEYKAYLIACRESGERHEFPELKIPYKLQNNALAQSHGVPVPAIHQVWTACREIDLAALPPSVVVKSDSGTAAKSVFPVHRDASGNRWTMADGSRTFTIEELRATMSALGEKALSPYFAEELLTSIDDSPVPDDIKVYCMYGEPVQVLLVRPAREQIRNRGVAARRYLGPDGTDLGEVMPGVTYDADIPVPTRLPEIIEAASHLSLTVGIPFCRIDFYETDTGFAFGEITRDPGGTQRYTAAHDETMGAAWVRARARLNRDLARGRPHGLVYGDQPYTWHYLHHDSPRRPVYWHREHVSCDEWCRNVSPAPAR